MTFLKTQSKEKIALYVDYLKAIGAFSNLYSSSEKPFIQYRVAENVFCSVFNAENLARIDGAFDAIIDNIGIGIKTFILSGESKIEKVAEFNSLSAELRKFKGKELAFKLADYRNDRIEFADRAYDVSKRFYHIVGRDKLVIKLFEVGYDLIDKESIVILNDTGSSLKFKDSKNEYTFNYSKSVLMKRFTIPKDFIEIDIDIIENPIDLLLCLINPDSKYQAKSSDLSIRTSTLKLMKDDELAPGVDYVILPLYSTNAKKSNNEPIVPLKSQLNQWNAGGRKRDLGEVYITIPKIVHDLSTNFFPPRDVIFDLKVPSGEVLKAKVCQDGGKALMTNPNNAMSNWILRKVLKLREGELLKYNQLKRVGHDSVKITKIKNNDYLIDFAPLDAFENFIESLKD